MMRCSTDSGYDADVRPQEALSQLPFAFIVNCRIALEDHFCIAGCTEHPWLKGHYYLPQVQKIRTRKARGLQRYRILDSRHHSIMMTRYTIPHPEGFDPLSLS